MSVYINEVLCVVTSHGIKGSAAEVGEAIVKLIKNTYKIQFIKYKGQFFN